MKLSGCSAGEISASHDFDLIASQFQSSSDPILLNGNSYWSELKSVQARDHKIPFPYFFAFWSQLKNHFFSKMTKGESQRSKLPILNRDDVRDSLDTELVFIMVLSTIMVFAILQLLISRRKGWYFKIFLNEIRMVREFHESCDINPKKTQVQNNTESLESDKEAINHLFKVSNL